MNASQPAMIPGITDNGQFVAIFLLIACSGLIIVLERQGIPVIARLRSLFGALVGFILGLPGRLRARLAARDRSSLSISAARSKDVEADEAAQWGDERRGPNVVGLGTGEQVLLSSADMKQLISHLPSRCHGRDWNLVFSSSRDGYDLSTLYSKVRGRGPTLIVVMDDQQHVFGGFASRDWSGSDLVTGSVAYNFIGSTTANGMASALSPAGLKTQQHARGAYFGSGESFVFSIRPNFNVFRWTRKNNLFMLGRGDCIAFGGGGSKFGLWLDAGLERGSSGTCDTYSNPPLASSEMFRIVRVEAWAFALPQTLARDSGYPSLSIGGAVPSPSAVADKLKLNNLKQSAKSFISQWKGNGGSSGNVAAANGGSGSSVGTPRS